MNNTAVAKSSFATSLVRYSRSWGLWVLLLVAPVGARFWIPNENDTSVVIAVNDKAPVMTSAMLGVSLGIVISTLLLPIAFIYLRSNVTRRQPWQIEEVSPGSRVAIALGRFGADVVIWGAVLAAMTLAGWVIAWLLMAGERINLWEVTLALWLVAAPPLLGVAAIRILFDALSITRGALGEVLYFILWMASIAMPAIGAGGNASFAGNMTDFAGFVRPLSHNLPPDQQGNFAIGATSVQAGKIELDVLGGLLSEGYVASRFTWAAIAVGVAALSGIVYMPHRPGRQRGGKKRLAKLLEPGRPRPADPDAPDAPFSRWPFLGLVAGEFRLIPLGRLWLLLALAIAVLSAFADFRMVASPAALLLLIFGLTAHAGRTERPMLLALTSTAPLSPWSRRAALILAGIAWSVAMAIPALARTADGQWLEPLWLSFATGAATSAAAILLAAWTRSAFAPRLVLLIAWYIYLSAS